MPKLNEFKYIEIRDVNILLDEVKKYINIPERIKDIEDAYYFAEKMHSSQKRKSGDPYIYHPLSTAYYLAQWQMGPNTIMAGLLHDVIEDTPISKEELEDQFGLDVTSLIEAVTKVSYFTKENREQMKAQYLRKLFISMIKDIRVIIIKIADRLHNILTLKYMSEEKQKIIAKETLDVYAAIAHRIGMKNVKSILEDRCFEVLNPEEYKKILKLLQNDIEENKLVVKKIIKDISDELSKKRKMNNITVIGRSKSIYSIYRKITLFGKNFSDIHDLLAVRIICDNVDDCYKILGAIHQKYTPLSSKFKDYIATPKNNLYQSIHTIISDKLGTIFEVQIRTYEMDEIAENGVAAHWKYKDTDTAENVAQKQKEIDEKVDLFTRLTNLEKLAVQGNEVDYNSSNFLSEEDAGKVIEETLVSDYLTPMIFVVSPNGSVTTLPFGSSVLDFAYKIHTDIGNKTIGAKINGVFYPVNTILNSGEMVEIQTDENPTIKSKWLKCVITNTARKAIQTELQKINKIKAKEEETSNRALIKKAKLEIQEYILKHNLVAHLNNEKEINIKLKVIDFDNIDEFLIHVGRGDFTTKEAVDLVYANIVNLDEDKILNMKTKKYISNKSHNDVIINNTKDIFRTIAQCCYPIPKEPIAAYISKNAGIQIHRKKCINVLAVKNKNNLLSATWNLKNITKRKYIVKLRFAGIDRPGMLFDITKLLSQNQVNIIESKILVLSEEYQIKGTLLIEIENTYKLDLLLKSFALIPNISKVTRVFTTKD